jgi:hypothetical protein
MVRNCELCLVTYISCKWLAGGRRGTFTKPPAGPLYKGLGRGVIFSDPLLLAPPACLPEAARGPRIALSVHLEANRYHINTTPTAIHPDRK